MSQSFSLQVLDTNITRARETYGVNSTQFQEAVDAYDREIERQAIACDGWTDAEIRAMNGERL